MKRRLLLSGALGSPALVLLRVASAQTPAKAARVGWLTAQRAPSLAPYVSTFRSALAGLGWVEGQNLTIDFRYGDDAIERVPALAAELLRLPVDLIVAQGAAVYQIGEMAAKTPQVFVVSADPVLSGLADSLAQPRGNRTGLTFMSVEFNGKRLELLREIIPNLRRVAIIANPEHAGEVREHAHAVEVGRRLGLAMQYLPVSTRPQLDAALGVIASDPPQAISVFADGFALQNRQAIIDAGLRLRVPVISGWAAFAESGALCTYGPRLSASYRRLAYYADRILRGAKPADLPIEQPAEFEMVMNLKTASALGLTIPPSVLLRADRTIQ